MTLAIPLDPETYRSFMAISGFARFPGPATTPEPEPGPVLPRPGWSPTTEPVEGMVLIDFAYVRRRVKYRWKGFAVVEDRSRKHGVLVRPERWPKSIWIAESEVIG